MHEPEVGNDLIDPTFSAADLTMAAGGSLRPEVIALQENHLTFFKNSIPAGPITDPDSKNKPRRWAECTGLGEQLPDASMNRQNLLDLAADLRVSVSVVCWSILAWGGMHGRHRDAINKQPDTKWLDLAGKIRAGEYSRSQAYEAFSKLKDGGNLKGMGPAYWTKLIFFLMPRSVASKPIGFIMDQWVGCAINLLSDRQIVLMNYSWVWGRSKRNVVVPSVSFVVSDVNTSDRYEEYCRYIEKTALEIERPPHETELLLMSDGGRNKQPWRQYIIRSRLPPS